MESDRKEARNEVIEAMARSAELYGMNQSYGRIYGELYFSQEPQSLDEIAEKSGYAKSTVSNVMRDLENLHMVRRRTSPESGKRVYFEAVTDFWRVLQEILQHQVKREIRIMTNALEDAEEKFDEPGEEAHADIEKIRKLKDIYEQADDLIEIFTDMSPEEMGELVKAFESRD
ncbi:MAG: MarR family transcriptional regulator [Halobacteria archaeon]|nr:MarR family transcriptional regulator [Halobacteria archaeon]